MERSEAIVKLLAITFFLIGVMLATLGSFSLALTPTQLALFLLQLAAIIHLSLAVMLAVGVKRLIRILLVAFAIGVMSSLLGILFILVLLSL